MSTIKSGLIKILIASIFITPFSLEKVQAVEGIVISSDADKKLSTIMNIDNPVSNSTVSVGKSITINGWALNESGIKEVKIYLDNLYLGNATMGISRPDVKKVYPEYMKADKSGFEYTINNSSLSEGAKTIKVQAIGIDGTSQQYSIKVNVSKLSSKMNIDDPISNNTINGNIKVRGWALNSSGIKEVKIYVNNSYVGSAALGKSRPDVKNAFPSYTDGDRSGYEYTIDTSSMAVGSKTIKVQAIGNDGSTQESASIVKFDKLASYMWIDGPSANSTIKGNVNVRGWALNSSGIKEVKIYVNNSYVGSAVIGKSRPDVKNAFPAYTYGDKSGYEYTIDASSISSGIKTLKVQAIGNDGTIQESNVNVNIAKLNPIMNIDDPVANSEVKDNIKVRGWALNSSGIKEVKLYVDNTYIGNASIGVSRPDVGRAYPEYINGDKSGYEFNMNTLPIAAGMRELKVEAIGNDGSSKTYSLKVNIVKLSPMTHIDEPSVNNIVNGKVKVRGWALNASGIKEIKLYVDNNYVGSATSGLSRSDVGKVYPQYINANISGYEYTVDTSSINQGTKTIKVQAIGNDGSQNEVTIKVSIVNSITTYVTYPNTFNSYLDIQIEKKPLIQDKYTLLWRYATRDEIAYYMNPANFINDPAGKYMFLKLSYSDGIQASQLNNVLKGKGVLEGKGDAFIEAGKRANVNPIYLVAHALLETGNGTSTLARGAIKVDKLHEEFGNVKSSLKSVESKTIYNMYGIGALDSDADLWGSEKAYAEGWFTVEDAIIGGAKWIGNGYINSITYNQNTLYKMRWDFTTSSMWHQYATDVGWAYKQTVRIKNIIDAMDNPLIHLEIPTFNK
ncbi:Ig-like domain-containing protein [Clostridium sp. YIM B02506]|uniref:Ig-like domain-containing protein n=1 Tax=Clostridium sp. YIM B02506 TaxID=2910680 RepID=UPI001EED5555